MLSATNASDLLSLLTDLEPLTLVGYAALIVLVISLRRDGVRSARKRLEAEVERWRTSLASAADRLLELEKGHPLYFTAKQRWTGESLELDRRCGQRVNRTYQIYSKAHELLQGAEDALSQGGTWKSANYDRGWGLLREEAVVLDEGAGGGRLTEHASGPFRTKAAALLEDLDTAYRLAQEELSAVATLEESFREISGRADRAAAEATHACSRRADLELATEHLTADLEPALDEKRRIEEELATDPTRAIQALEPVVLQLSDLARRATSGNRLAEALRGSTPSRLQNLRERISALRQDGWSLTEPGFDPDLRVDRGERQLVDIERLLDAGEDAEAEAEHQTLLDGLLELDKMIDTAVQARQQIVHEIERLETEVGLLRERLPKARRTLANLAKEHPASSYRDAGDNLEELVPVLDEIDGWIRHIGEDHGEQRYLSAVEDAGTARDLLEEGNGLIEEIENAARTLEAQREQARRDLDQAERRGQTFAALREEPGLSRSHVARYEAQMQKLEATRRAAAGERPDWSEIAGVAVDIEGELAHLEEIAKLEREAYEEALGQKPALSALMRSLSEAARQERRDRAHVAEAVEATQDLFDAFLRDLESGEGSGRQLMEKSRELASRLAWANGVWRSELDVIHQASTELRAAEVKLQQEDGRQHGHGVVTRCDQGRSLVDQARQASQNLQWEHVLSLAHRASEAIDEEARRGRQEAARRQDEERRRLRAAERRRKVEIATSIAQAALGTAAVLASRGDKNRGARHPWPSAGTAASSFGHRGKSSKKSRKKSKKSKKSKRRDSWD